MRCFPADSGVLSPRALDSNDASLAASCVFLLGVCKTLSSTSPSTALLLLGVPVGKRSNKPSTMPSRCGVGPMTLGPCGDRNSGDCGIASNARSSPRFLFSGVEVWNSGGPLGVCSASCPDAPRLAFRFEGVCGAAGAVDLLRSLLYSLYLLAGPCKLIWLENVVCRVHTYLLVCLDVIASCFPATVLSCKLFLPDFQVVSEDIATVFDLCDTHGEMYAVLVRK